jgi:putative membrane protein
MDFLKIALRDIGSIFKNRFIRISVIAIIVVPLLYSLLYLAAFWDPYNRLSSLPVAVVNLDEGTIKDGTKVNYGNDLVDKLKENDKVGWQFVSLEEAKDKVESKDGYYGMFVVSKDFSKNVVSAKDGKPEKAQISFVENDKKSFLAAQINGKVLSELKLVLNGNISKEYTVATFDSLYELKDGMIKAADGSKELKDGLNTLNGKVPELKDGVTALADGSKQLSDGLNTLNGKVPTLADGSKAVSDGLNTLNGKLPELKDGVVQLYDGSSKLNDGLGQVQTGVGALYGGAAQINGGLGDAKSGAVQISDGLSQMNEQVPALEKGVSDLYNGSGSLKDGIDKAATGATQINQGIKDFSDKAITPVASGIAQLDGALNQQVLPGMKQLSDGAGQVSVGVDELINNMTTSQTAMANALAAYQKKVAEGTATAADTQNMVVTMSTILKASSTPENQQKVKALKDGAKMVSDGSKSAYVNLSGDFKKGLDGLNSNMTNVKAGADKLDKGSSDLASGLGAAAGGAKALSDGLAQLNVKVPSLSSGVSKLNDGSKGLVLGLDKLYLGSGQLKNSIAKPEQVKNLQASNSSSGATLFEGVTALKDGALQLNGGLGSLNSNVPELAGGVSKLADGSSQVASGNAQVADGVAKLADGGNKLNDGLGQLNDKIPELQDGVIKLENGATELSDKLSEGADKLTKNLVNDSKTMGDFVAEPLVVDENPINPVKDYGTGFAPYFIPLSLWVGALMMFFVITEDVDGELEASPASLVLGKFFSYAFVGTTQAVLVSIVVMMLGLKPDSIPLYFLTNILMSFAFIAIIQCLIFLMGQVGRLLSIVLLILQLTSCAGTFPLELVPKLFKVLNPYMPFTYCVSALREVISGLDASVYAHDVTILAAILVVFLVISVIMKGHADKVKVKIQERKEAIA